MLVRARRLRVAEVVIKQVRSGNRSNRKQLDTLRSLRLGRIGREVKMAETPQLRGMLRVVDHLVEVSGEDGEGK
jgi:large subunit ribosomal protein L30